ncbi:MAG: CsgG/HfaB family protein [Halanaerobiales bacterium]
MQNMNRLKGIGIIIICLIFIISFSTAAEDKKEEMKELQEEILNNSEQIKSAEHNVTTSTQLLAALSEAEEKSAIAVFKISDKTGERKATGASVVSQGATDMLITALVRSRHFEVLDRVVDNNIMQEQDLQKNNLLSSGDNPSVNQLKGADYFITGAVTEYQVDKKTGGMGINIAGLGGSKEYAVATTAIDLRIIDSTSGEVVWSRSLKDKIKGEKVDLQAFSFMGNNIVELETGKGEQEVINLILRNLIEEGVFELCQSDLE